MKLAWLSALLIGAGIGSFNFNQQQTNGSGSSKRMPQEGANGWTELQYGGGEIMPVSDDGDKKKMMQKYEREKENVTNMMTWEEEMFLWSA